MSWNNEPEHKLTPKERAKEIRDKFFHEIRQQSTGFKSIILTHNCAIICQESRISALNDHGIKSEYEDKVLTEIKKL